jgi:hypothetical protein
MKPSPSILWTVEDRGVTVMDLDGTPRLCIPYPWAALWALVSNGNYDPGYAMDLLTILMPLSPEEAQGVVADVLRTWQELELLSRE